MIGRKPPPGGAIMTDDKVRSQYETYPYPARDPADEAKRLIVGSPSHLLELNHHVFAGRRDFSKPFRVLVAGGGTGDATIMLAQQLADQGCPSLVTYMDLSSASRAIAEARATARGLDNVRFVTMSLLDLPGSDLGPFDYIDCCGVLHHLEKPEDGLRALTGVLAEDGGMGLMLYGEYGRAGVYAMQSMMRTLAPDDPTPDRIAVTRRLMEQLPATNWVKRNPFVGDHLNGGDAGLFDLFLHSRDRAFRVPEITALTDKAGLRITAFIEPALYDPASYLNDPQILSRLASLPWLDRCAFAERLAGNMQTHVFYVIKKENPLPTLTPSANVTAVPHLHETDAPTLSKSLKPSRTLSATVNGNPFRFPLPPLAAAMVSRMDGKRSLREIFQDLCESNSTLDWATFEKQFLVLYAALHGLGRLFLTVSGPAEQG
jgi:SAM-dependent methyltransferase